MDALRSPTDFAPSHHNGPRHQWQDFAAFSISPPSHTIAMCCSGLIIGPQRPTPRVCPTVQTADRYAVKDGHEAPSSTGRRQSPPYALSSLPLRMAVFSPLATLPVTRGDLVPYCCRNSSLAVANLLDILVRSSLKITSAGYQPLQRSCGRSR